MRTSLVINYEIVFSHCIINFAWLTFGPGGHCGQGEIRNSSALVQANLELQPSEQTIYLDFSLSPPHNPGKLRPLTGGRRREITIAYLKFHVSN